MNLSEFIVESLAQITAGIRDARAVVGNDLVAPSDFGKDKPIAELTLVLLQDGQTRRVQMVEFDVALTVSTEASGKIKLGVLSLGIGADAGRELRNEQATRVRFKIPLALPSAPGE